MKLFEGAEFKIQVSDIETYLEMALFTFYNPDTKEWKEFEINAYQNDLDTFIDFYENHPIDFLVFFNGLGFDQQVIEWIKKEKWRWKEKTGLEIAKMISEYASFVIDNSQHKVRHQFLESDFHVSELDLFKIWHYDREQRSTGLKKLEFSMDFPTIEELPFNPSKTGLTREECDEIKRYCRNDVLATNRLLDYTLGNVEHTLYKGDNKIELRFSMRDQFNMNSLNISNTKIGDNIIRKEYSRISGIPEKDLPRKGYFRKEISVKYCIPKYIKFTTYKLQEFLRNIKQITLKSGEEFSEKIDVEGRIYKFAKGGIHSENKGEYYQTEGDYFIIDWDVTSYYPWIMINNNYAPHHVDKESFIEALRTIVVERTRLKPQAKKDKKIAGIVGGLKIAANSVYGFTSDVYSGWYDPLVTLQVCLTGELSLLMLIEAYTEAGIDVISANTDGVTLKVHKDCMQKMYDINAEWMNMTGYLLEKTEYKFIAFSTVNDYIAQKIDDGKSTLEERLKVKGDFLIDSELHGDKSRRIIRIALHDYFIDGKNVEETIKNHKNIYDFCAGVKSSKDYHYELLDQKKNDRIELKKMVRYYLSTDGRVLLKIKNPESEKTGNPESQVESPKRVNDAYQPLVNYFNTFEEKENYKINFDYYTKQAQDTINFIMQPKNKKGKIVEVNPNQISMF